MSFCLYSIHKIDDLQITDELYFSKNNEFIDECYKNSPSTFFKYKYKYTIVEYPKNILIIRNDYDLECLFQLYKTKYTHTYKNILDYIKQKYNGICIIDNQLKVNSFVMNSKDINIFLELFLYNSLLILNTTGLKLKETTWNPINYIKLNISKKIQNIYDFLCFAFDDIFGLYVKAKNIYENKKKTKEIIKHMNKEFDLIFDHEYFNKDNYGDIFKINNLFSISKFKFNDKYLDDNFILSLISNIKNKYTVEYIFNNFKNLSYENYEEQKIIYNNNFNEIQSDVTLLKNIIKYLYGDISKKEEDDIVNISTKCDETNLSVDDYTFLKKYQ